MLRRENPFPCGPLPLPPDSMYCRPTQSRPRNTCTHHTCPLLSFNNSRGLLELPGACGPQRTEPLSPVPPRDLTEFEKAQPPPPIDLDVPIWYIRDTMINSAIDEDLARTIFTHIRARQAGDRRLAKLDIRPLYNAPAVAARSISKASESNISKALAPHWIIQTDFLAGIKAVIHKQSMQKQDHHPVVYQRGVQLEVIFNSVWPLVEGEKEQCENKDNWLQRRRSWPLQ
ncbi:hypothetical protein N7478_000013 [Penicillium angulare]|uniref:uncharacterized protein n=1 Tax=Penicillium angulare TaxID=116970 RepID=UPI0025424250|nr:uncharacterized protein N7478_000013 [Penicillium angulare]KAJ5290762.1 hypothetical protein N7478_000013 [Penicillium angulare]